MSLICFVVVTNRKQLAVSICLILEFRGLLKRGFYCLQNFVINYSFVESTAAVYFYDYPFHFSLFPPLPPLPHPKFFHSFVYLFICFCCSLIPFFFLFLSFFLSFLHLAFLQNKSADMIVSLL